MDKASTLDASVMRDSIVVNGFVANNCSLFILLRHRHSSLDHRQNLHRRNPLVIIHIL